MKSFISVAAALSLLMCVASCNEQGNGNSEPPMDTSKERQQINALLDAFNEAAASADFDAYFALYAPDAIFTGTDATERWNKQEFMAYAKPYFDRGSTWDFTSLDRHIYFDSTGNLAWFDELLQTQMRLCRGSGVLVKQGDDWKIQQYILTATVPNSIMDSVIQLKAPIEDSLIQELVK